MRKTSEIRYLQIDTSKKIRWLAIYIQSQEGFQEKVAAKLDMWGPRQYRRRNKPVDALAAKSEVLAQLQDLALNIAATAPRYCTAGRTFQKPTQSKSKMYEPPRHLLKNKSH